VDGKPKWLKIEPRPLEQFKAGLGAFDAATVSSELPVNDWKAYNPHFHYLPNFIYLIAKHHF